MPSIVAALHQALAAFESDDFVRMAAICRDILQLAPHNVHALRLLGAAARKQGRCDESIRWLSQAVDLAPADAALRFELGSSLNHAGRPDEAADCFLWAFELDPTLQPACVNLAAIQQQREHFDEALQWCRRALELNPTCPIAHNNLGTTLQSLGRIDEALAAYRRATELQPDFARAHWNVAFCSLLLGQFAAGWQAYEWRVPAGEVILDHYPQVRWDGSSLAGKTILVHGEQGVGDEILFASCLPDLIERAQRVVVVCEPRLAKLFARSFPQIHVYGYQRRKDHAPAPIKETIDAQIPCGSLPLFFRPDLHSFPHRERFLRPDVERVEHWRRRFAALGEGLKIGISWRAGGQPSQQRKRTTPLDDWRGLFSVPGLRFVNLQYGETSDEVAAAHQRWGVTIHDWSDSDPLVDLDDFAAKIAALDLVISVGNATVHLAGALGVPTWTVLPQVPGWRWMLTGENSPWYASIRLFRQPDRDAWRPVFARLEHMLREKSGQAAVGSGQFSHQNGNARPRRETRNSKLETAAPGSVFRDVSVFRTHDVMTTLEDAVRRHKAGDFAAAEAVYREVLQHMPRHAPTLDLFGVLANQTGRQDLAIKLMGRAIAVTDAVPLYHYHLADALRDAGRFDEALASYRRCIELHPDLAEAHLNCGGALQKLGRYEEAIDCFKRAAELKPAAPESRLNLGNTYRLLDRRDEAIGSYREAIRAQPVFAKAHNALGATLLEMSRLPEAIQSLQRAIELKPDYFAAHNNLGQALQRAGRLDEAVQQLRRAVSFDPRCFEAQSNLAAALKDLGQFAAAAEHYRRAIELRPQHPELHNDLGAMLESQGDFDGALAGYERAIALKPLDKMPHVNRAVLWLQTGNFRHGWDEYAWRLNDAKPWTPAVEQIPVWNGGSLADRTLLVQAEQGLGDEIMFATCFPDVIARAARCVLACDVRLERLFARSFPRATVYGIPRGNEDAWRFPANENIDLRVSAGSLPRFVRRDAASFPRRGRLLVPDTTKVATWRERLANRGAGIKIGISWRAGFKAREKRQRSTTLSQWSELLTTPNTQFVCLQHGATPQELAEAQHETGITIHAWPELDAWHDIDGLAALVGALDLVISVGNSTVHLAGALGTPAWALLPCFGGWRWQIGRDDSPWYSSVRLFRQARLDDWAELFDRARRALEQHLTNPSRTHLANNLCPTPLPH